MEKIKVQKIFREQKKKKRKVRKRIGLGEREVGLSRS